MLKRVLTFALALLMILSLVACGGKEDETANTGDFVDTNSEGDGLPDKNMEGFELKILHDDGGYIGKWTNVQMDAEGIEGNVVNDEIYARNQAVQQRFNCKLTIEGKTCVLATDVTKWASAGDAPYDVVYIITWGAAKMNDVIIDLNEVPYLSLDESWWHPELRSISEANGKQFSATSSLSLSQFGSARGILFNKTLYDRVEPGKNLYDYLDSNTWNWETFSRICKDAYVIADDAKNNVYSVGNTAVKDLYLGLINGSGLSFVDVNADNKLEFTVDKELAAHVDKLGAFAKMPEYGYINDNPIDMETDRSEGDVKNGTALFQIASINALSNQDIRNSQYDFGFMPNPKYTSEQDRYYSNVHTYECMTIMNTVKFDRYENIGIILEALAYSSYHGVLKKYLEDVVTFRYSPDLECMEVMLLIQDTLYVDPGSVLLVNEYNDLCKGFFLAGGGGNISSGIATYKSKIEGKIKDYNESMK